MSPNWTCKVCGEVHESQFTNCWSCGATVEGQRSPDHATLVAAVVCDKDVVVKTYTGSQASATAQFQSDSAKMATKGYFPTSQSWAPGSYGCGSFIIALLLCAVVIGVLIFIYMLLVKPDGTLTVTYERREHAKHTTDEKTCPKCAETVKGNAKICRFCRHEF